jgi:hypothetical protein
LAGSKLPHACSPQFACAAKFQVEISREKKRVEMLLDIFRCDRKMCLCLTVSECCESNCALSSRCIDGLAESPSGRSAYTNWRARGSKYQSLALRAV